MTLIPSSIRRRAVVFAFACITLCCPVASPAQDLVLRNATVIDGRGGAPVTGANVVIQNGRITNVTLAMVKMPAGTRVLDLTGRWVIPGLVDAHVHVATDPTGADQDARDRLARAFRGGVTMVRDMGGDAIVLRELAGWAAADTAAAPRIHYSALFAGPSFFTDPRTIASAHGGVPGELPWLRAVRDTTDLRRAVAEGRATGATGVKIYANLTAAQVAAVAREGRRQKMPVWSHATVFPALPSDAVAGGVNVISHATSLIWETQRPVPPNYHEGRTALRALDPPMLDSAGLAPLFARMKKANTMLEPTLYVSEMQPSLAKIAPWCRQVTGLAHRAGVELVAGTDDIGAEPDSLPNLHRELELLVACGLTPLEALTAGTRNGARALGQGEAYGTIEKGKVADLVVLDADPTVAIGNTRRVRMVIKSGHVFETSADAGTSPAGH